MYETIISNQISVAKTLLDEGNCVAIPTETVYGLAANALDPIAVSKIFEAKRRPFFDPLIIHVAKQSSIHGYVKEIPSWALALAETFMPGPITLLLEKKSIVPDIVTSGLPKVAIRIPKHPLTIELLSLLDYPLAAPSANPFGYVSPTNALHVSNQLQGQIPMILDGGNCMVGLESTIIGEENGQIIVYRLGGMDVEHIQQIVGEVYVKPHSSSNPQAPGMLQSHYAPRKKMYYNTIASIPKNTLDRTAVIGFNTYIEGFPKENQFLLSPQGNLQEAAAKLFAELRRLDNSEFEQIFAVKFPDFGLGLAINDRLLRASIKTT
jgi:L-threonylcarbamoyladenylate synthase